MLVAGESKAAQGKRGSTGEQGPEGAAACSARLTPPWQSPASWPTSCHGTQRSRERVGQMAIGKGRNDGASSGGSIGKSKPQATKAGTGRGGKK